MARNPPISEPQFDQCTLVTGVKAEGTANETRFAYVAETKTDKNYRAQWSAGNFRAGIPRKGKYDKENQATVSLVWQGDDPYTQNTVIPYFEQLTDYFNNNLTPEQRKELQMIIPPQALWEGGKKGRSQIKWEECPIWQIKNPLYHNEERNTYSILITYNLDDFKVSDKVTIKKTHIRDLKSGQLLEPQALLDEKVAFDGTATGFSVELTGKYKADVGYAKMHIKFLCNGLICKKKHLFKGDDDDYYMEQLRLEMGDQVDDDEDPDLLARLTKKNGPSAASGAPGAVAVTAADRNDDGGEHQDLAEAYGSNESPKPPPETAVVKKAIAIKK